MNRIFSFSKLRYGLILMSVFAFLWMTGGNAQADWKEEWQKIVEGAKKEGRLVVYGGEEITHQEILDEFTKKYPEIKVVTGSGRGSPAFSRSVEPEST